MIRSGGEEAKEVAGCCAPGTAGREEDRARVPPGAAAPQVLWVRSVAEVAEVPRAGRAARERARGGWDGAPQSGLSGTGARESRARQGAPAGIAGRRRGAAPRPPGTLGREEKVRPYGRAALFCLLASRRRRSASFPSVQYLPLCNLLGAKSVRPEIKPIWQIGRDRRGFETGLLCWDFCRTALMLRLTMSGRRKGVWTGQNLERKFVAGLGRAGLGCDRRILSQVLLLDPRTSEPACHGNCWLGNLIWPTGLGVNLSWETSRPLSSCA